MILEIFFFYVEAGWQHGCQCAAGKFEVELLLMYECGLFRFHYILMSTRLCGFHHLLEHTINLCLSSKKLRLGTACMRVGYRRLGKGWKQ